MNRFFIFMSRKNILKVNEMNIYFFSIRKEKLDKRRKLKIKRENCFMLLKNTLMFVLVS
jgi:hypothetical protein